MDRSRRADRIEDVFAGARGKHPERSVRELRKK